jgi:hypothetical protein
MNCLRPLEHWGLGFESNSRHWCLYCVRLFCVCVVLCVGSGLETGWSPVQGVLPTVYMITKLKKAARAQQRAIEPLMNEYFFLLYHTLMINYVPYLYWVGSACVSHFGELMSRGYVGFWVLVCVWAWVVLWGCVCTLYPDTTTHAHTHTNTHKPTLPRDTSSPKYIAHNITPPTHAELTRYTYGK